MCVRSQTHNGNQVACIFRTCCCRLEYAHLCSWHWTWPSAWDLHSLQWLLNTLLQRLQLNDGRCSLMAMIETLIARPCISEACIQRHYWCKLYRKTTDTFCDGLITQLCPFVQLAWNMAAAWELHSLQWLLLQLSLGVQLTVAWPRDKAWDSLTHAILKHVLWANNASCAYNLSDSLVHQAKSCIACSGFSFRCLWVCG